MGRLDNRGRPKRDVSISGFTLIEIVLALLILGVGVVGVLTLFPVGFEAAGRSINITVATFLAQGLVEDARVAGYDGVLDSARERFSTPYDNFEYQITVTSDIDGLDLKQVDAEVFWPAGESNQKHILLTTYIGKYGP